MQSGHLSPSARLFGIADKDQSLLFLPVHATPGFLFDQLRSLQRLLNPGVTQLDLCVLLRASFATQADISCASDRRLWWCPNQHQDTTWLFNSLTCIDASNSIAS